MVVAAGSRAAGCCDNTAFSSPQDYSHEAIFNRDTRALMETIAFEHGGREYDEKYPDGIPTSIIITLRDGSVFDSGLVMYPAGHARNTAANLRDILDAKFEMLARLASDGPREIIARFSNMNVKSAKEIGALHDFTITKRDAIE